MKFYSDSLKSGNVGQNIYYITYRRYFTSSILKSWLWTSGQALSVPFPYFIAGYRTVLVQVPYLIPIFYLFLLSSSGIKYSGNLNLCEPKKWKRHDCDPLIWLQWEVGRLGVGAAVLIIPPPPPQLEDRLFGQQISYLKY